MPTGKEPFELRYFVKSDNTASGWERIGTLKTLPYDPWIYKPDLSEELLLYLEEDVRSTNETYMRIHYTIKKVIFSGPATIVIWLDGTKTVVKCMEGDIYDPEKALMMCVMERLLGGSKMEVKRFLKKWINKEVY